MEVSEVKSTPSLADLIAQMPSSDDLAWDHAMDISGSVYTRLKELKMTQKELAKKLDVTPGRVTQIIKGDPGMTLKTLARLECALNMRLDEGFRYASQKKTRENAVELWSCSEVSDCWHSKRAMDGITRKGSSWKSETRRTSGTAANHDTYLKLVEDAA